MFDSSNSFVETTTHQKKPFTLNSDLSLDLEIEDRINTASINNIPLSVSEIERKVMDQVFDLSVVNTISNGLESIDNP